MQSKLQAKRSLTDNTMLRSTPMLYICVACIIATTSCSSDSSGGGQPLVVNEIGSLPLEPREDEWASLEQPDSAFLVGIGGVDVEASGRVLIADPSEGNVKEYAKNGQLIRVIGQKGHGPGEFGNPRFPRYDDRGNIYVVDLASGAINEFTNTGSYVGQFKPDGINAISGFEVLTDTTFLLSGHEAVPTPSHVLFVVKKGGQPVRRLLPIWTTKPRGASEQYLWNSFRSFPFTVAGDTAYVLCVASDSLWTVHIESGAYRARRLEIEGVPPMGDFPKGGFGDGNDFIQWVLDQYMATTPSAVGGTLFIPFAKGGDVMADDVVTVFRNQRGHWAMARGMARVIRAHHGYVVIAQGPVEKVKLAISQRSSE